MKIAAYDAVCGALPGATKVVQWGGMHVWKVGGKMFSVADGTVKGHVAPWFKASDRLRPMLLERDGVVPAPYLARAGWVALTEPKAMKDQDLAAYLKDAHRTIAAKLPKKQRAALGFDPSI
ncbi:MmcQ/YjbR family DNA-binding protein [Methylovirgula sp. 4M-Z18]|uniref:MmcQ/YjbR family DNA-binding protein n=1 Tax=Methylovirgula sp. 4M-Z18 TaxID=2293567 RepID=UPI000E2EE500|nr:MmcQ/YjbR family DNA-binding protein [Methylovirgula sp. 4M-Z18]RFB75547.1 MmcQ/YjbR family DNA-binding protein [Methylovirgula sp. 4M-Z18]